VIHNTKRYYEKRLRKKVGQAISDYSMINNGDRVLLAFSGGRDSIVLLKILSDLKRAAPVEYEIIPVHISTGFERDFERISLWIKDHLGIEVLEIESGISEIMKEVSDPDKSPCALCSRLRRGKLYHVAQDMGVSSIALGHHMDDIVETFFLRCFYTGQIGAMSPSRISNDGKNRVIRPMAYCRASMVSEYFNFFGLEPVTNRCIIRSDSKREMIRDMISDMETDIPMVVNSVFASLGNIDMKSLGSKGSYAHPH